MIVYWTGRALLCFVVSVDEALEDIVYVTVYVQ
jgi:hypothetical protein